MCMGVAAQLMCMCACGFASIVSVQGRVGARSGDWVEFEGQTLNSISSSASARAEQRRNLVRTLVTSTKSYNLVARGVSSYRRTGAKLQSSEARGPKGMAI